MHNSPCFTHHTDFALQLSVNWTEEHISVTIAAFHCRDTWSNMNECLLSLGWEMGQQFVDSKPPFILVLSMCSATMWPPSWCIQYSKIKIKNSSAVCTHTNLILHLLSQQFPLFLHFTSSETISRSSEIAWNITKQMKWKLIFCSKITYPCNYYLSLLFICGKRKR